MSRSEFYPWSLLLEVGDYFIVPESVKPHSYMSQLVAQRNYRGGKEVKLSSVKTTHGTLVIVVQVGEEMPPYEFVTPEGIYASTSRQHLIRTQAPDTPLGDRPVRAKKTVSQLVEAMTQDQRIANLPWWYDKKGTLVFNPKVATPEDLDKWYNKQKMPGPDQPYPDYYHLDENLIRREPTNQSGVDVDEELEGFWGDPPIVDGEQTA